MIVKVDPCFVKRQRRLPQVHYARMNSRVERACVSAVIIPLIFKQIYNLYQSHNVHIRIAQIVFLWISKRTVLSNISIR